MPTIKSSNAHCLFKAIAKANPPILHSNQNRGKYNVGSRLHETIPRSNDDNLRVWLARKSLCGHCELVIRSQ